MEAEPARQCDIVIGHFDRVLSLAKRLIEVSAEIHWHEYDPHFFGMWRNEEFQSEVR
jgi:hypothetical protein